MGEAMGKAGSEAGHFVYLYDYPYTSFEGKRCPFHGNCSQQTFTRLNCGLGEVLLQEGESISQVPAHKLDRGIVPLPTACKFRVTSPPSLLTFLFSSYMAALPLLAEGEAGATPCDISENVPSLSALGFGSGILEMTTKASATEEKKIN